MATLSTVAANDFQLQLRTQVETAPDSGRYHQLQQAASWNPKETAVIVCDVWDLHHSQNAVRRATEFCPQLDRLLAEARRKGATIIHSPSDCMEAYKEHPARLRAMKAPVSSKLPDDIRSWCSRIPAEESAAYPIDQSDGGDDDDPQEHEAWVAKLKRLKRNVGTPWKSQTDLLTIDSQQDYISDRGDEVWNILEANQIKNVILTGVHTNMCVLGRPFGLRQMARNGKRVVLVRDLTDTMYNPARWPYVSHFAGTDLVISHIERYVCPTITSDQILGGKAFRFSQDQRKHLVVVIAEDEYQTNETVPPLAQTLLSDFRVTFVYGNSKERNDIPGLDALESADVAWFSVRRRTLPPKQLEMVRNYVAAGKPVIGIRTASHAFSLRKKAAPVGESDWPEFDREVFGGNYTNHHGNDAKSRVRLIDKSHPITSQLPPSPKEGELQHGSLYMTAPLATGAHVLLEGALIGKPDVAAEPVAWTHQRADGGKSFYSSIGHPQDMANPFYQKLLTSAVYWAADVRPSQANPTKQAYVDEWTITTVPQSALPLEAQRVLRAEPKTRVWLRCAARLTEQWVGAQGVALEWKGGAGQGADVWFNGHQATGRDGRFHAPREWIDLDDANLIVIRLPMQNQPQLEQAPVVHSADRQLKLSGRWQLRVGNDEGYSNIPLPARYGASTDILFEP